MADNNKDVVGDQDGQEKIRIRIKTTIRIEAKSNPSRVCFIKDGMEG